MKIQTEKRIEIERKIVRYMIRLMKANHWIATFVDDGEDVIKTRTESDVMQVVFSVEQSWIHFNKDHYRKSVFIVLGNDGLDCICDHSCSDEEDENDDFEGLMDIVSTYAEQFE